MQGLQTISEYVQCIVDGFIDMVDMVIILMLGYAMQECMYAMGMEDFVSAVCGAIPVASLLPFIFFVFFSCSEYLFSLNYTLYQIAIPVMMVVLPVQMFRCALVRLFLPDYSEQMRVLFLT